MLIQDTEVISDSEPTQDLALVIICAGLWTGAGVDTRPKFRDEQTLIGGAIWSQSILTPGLIISTVGDEHLYIYMHAYFILAGFILLFSTAFLLIIGEMVKLLRERRRRVSLPRHRDDHLVPIMEKYDKIYLAIGVLMLLASSLSMADFFLMFI